MGLPRPEAADEFPRTASKCQEGKHKGGVNDNGKPSLIKPKVSYADRLRTTSRIDQKLARKFSVGVDQNASTLYLARFFNYCSAGSKTWN